MKKNQEHKHQWVIGPVYYKLCSVDGCDKREEIEKHNSLLCAEGGCEICQGRLRGLWK